MRVNLKLHVSYLDMPLKEKYARIICYPQYSLKYLEERLREMRSLGVKALCFSGDKKIGGVPILGKGCVGIVVPAYMDVGRAALKIRRTDADRESMRHEAEMLRIANSVNVGPRLLGFTRNILLMEFVEGMPLLEWIEKVQCESDSVEKARKVLREILEQCRRLDEIGLDHGELSRAIGHIIVDYKDNPWILDFETASVRRRVSNVTSICHFLFLNGGIASLITKLICHGAREKLILALRRYKRSLSRRTFNEVLRKCGLIDQSIE
ncbi:serine/threonine protein kinase [Candidatus Bathyarchaeota archaeon]|nr:MAG: serine/threonine protein kinase [Candidatus Bathyarchaeota archaeon]